MNKNPNQSVVGLPLGGLTWKSEQMTPLFFSSLVGITTSYLNAKPMPFHRLPLAMHRPYTISNKFGDTFLNGVMPQGLSRCSG